MYMLTEQQEKWLIRVEELFFRFGIKALSMDDIARELGISKKTLYLFVENKDDLVNRVIDRHLQTQCVKDELLHKQSTDAIDEMFNVIQQITEEFQSIKPNMIFELQKYHHATWEKIQSFQRSYIFQIIQKNLIWGREDGLYREDFHLETAAKFYIISSTAIFDESWFPKSQFKLEILFKEVILNFLHSIVSEKGRQLMKTKNNLNKIIA
jgi:TetR/AcrR family transcriptional regulator, cholesterol catabolism regulator